MYKKYYLHYFNLIIIEIKLCKHSTNKMTTTVTMFGMRGLEDRNNTYTILLFILG